ncbi:hypothetical protein [Bradyrhizobium sp. USDA 4486]
MVVDRGEHIERFSVQPASSGVAVGHCLVRTGALEIHYFEEHPVRQVVVRNQSGRRCAVLDTAEQGAMKSASLPTNLTYEAGNVSFRAEALLAAAAILIDLCHDERRWASFGFRLCDRERERGSQPCLHEGECARDIA